MKKRRGFALHVVLWVMIGAAAVSMAAALRGRDGFDASRNRLSLERAHWSAVECAERARAAADELLAGSTRDAAARVWRGLNLQLDSAELLLASHCDVHAEAAGTRVDFNSASAEVLASLLSAAAADPRIADSVVAHRVQKPFADAAELRSFSPTLPLLALRDLLSVEPGRISINTAPATVLAAIPGFTEETVAAVMEMRRRSELVTDPLVLVSRLSASAANAFLARYPDIARSTTIDPDAWILTATSGAPASEVRATVELRLVRADRRAVVSRYRSWP